MSDDSNIWDDDGINWQELSSHVIDEAPNPSTVAITAGESSTRHSSERRVEFVGSTSTRDPIRDIPINLALHQQSTNWIVSERRTPAPTPNRSHLYHNSNNSTNSAAQDGGGIQQTHSGGSLPNHGNHSEFKNKRRRNKRKNRVKSKEHLETLLSSSAVTSPQAARIRGALGSYDDELSCPICLELFLAPQVLNPCGHSVCGDCISKWIGQNKDTPTCPTCRAKLSLGSPYLYNLVINNTVEKHIEVLRNNKDDGWKENGVKWRERQARKRVYEATKARKPSPPKWQSSSSHSTARRTYDEEVVFRPPRNVLRRTPNFIIHGPAW
ncbi:hypothetical protein FS842_001968 [Serendipita sp. 407]|nr:hypothetical protein FS842_001968 [Serendipita sp. 407]